MATIINNPGGESESSGVMFAVGAVVLLIVGAILLMNYLPATDVGDAPNEPGVNIEVVTPTAPQGAAPAPADTAE